MRSTTTLTFGDVAENHAGMERIGSLAAAGLSPEALVRVAAAHGSGAEVHELGALCPGAERAVVVVLRGAVDRLLGAGGADGVAAEHACLTPDTRALMRGRVVTKRARHNLCFSDAARAADYAAGRGTIVAWADVPETRRLRDAVARLFGAGGLQCEANYYYDVASPAVGIGFHGDGERRVGVGARFGASMRLVFGWWRDARPVGALASITLAHGDVYAMSDKAVGHDWRRRSVPTLRHAAGSEKFLERLVKSRRPHLDEEEVEAPT